MDPDKYPDEAGVSRVNERFTPRFHGGYVLAVRLARKMRDLKLHGLVDRMRKMGVTNLFGRVKTEQPAMDQRVRGLLQEAYAEEVRQFESFMGREISAWNHDFKREV